MTTKTTKTVKTAKAVKTTKAAKVTKTVKARKTTCKAAKKVAQNEIKLLPMTVNTVKYLPMVIEQPTESTIEKAPVVFFGKNINRVLAAKRTWKLGFVKADRMTRKAGMLDITDEDGNVVVHQAMNYATAMRFIEDNGYYVEFSSNVSNVQLETGIRINTNVPARRKAWMKAGAEVMTAIKDGKQFDINLAYIGL